MKLSIELSAYGSEQADELLAAVGLPLACLIACIRKLPALTQTRLLTLLPTARLRPAGTRTRLGG